MPSFGDSTAAKRSFRTILLADINSRSRELRSKAFRSLGADVQSAENADSAMAQYRDGTFELVLINLGGDIEGAELLATAMRAIDPHQKISFFVGGSALLSAFPAPKRNSRQAAAAAVEITAVKDMRRSSPSTQSDFGRRIMEAAKIQERGGRHS